jgi:RNA polymerase sigma factor (sigma-70 family)
MNIEKKLFMAAQAGDPVAMDQLLRALQPDIRRYARYQCHRATVIDDVVQEALIIIYRRMGDVRESTALASWIFRVVARLCMLPALALIRGTIELTHVEDNKHFAEMPQHELRIDLIRALESLPTMYRQIILLRDMEQLTIKEIAKCLELSVEATKSRIHRARALVREFMLADDVGAREEKS